MRSKMLFRSLPMLRVRVAVALAGPLSAAEVKSDSISGLQNAIEFTSPGAHIIIANGQYLTDGPIRVAAAGTAERPIVVTAASVGGAKLLGEARFRLHSATAYVVIHGFMFLLSRRDGIGTSSPPLSRRAECH